MWYPVDDGMVNLDRVAYIEVANALEVCFYNDARARLTEATFETEEGMRRYLDKLREELSYPIPAEDRARLPESATGELLEAAPNSDDE